MTDQGGVISPTAQVSSATQAELRSTSDSLLATLDRLADLEAEKRTLAPDDPRLVELAAAVKGLAGEILDAATVQGDLTEVAHVMAATDQPGAPTAPIEDIPRPLHRILEEWRAAERMLADASPGSREAAEALVATRELRAEYHRTFQALSQPERGD